MENYKKFVNENVGRMTEDQLKSIYDEIDKGDMVTIKYDSTYAGEVTKTFIVKKGKTKVGKFKVERITLENPSNPKGMKYYLYSRSMVSFATGDMGAILISLTIEK